MTDFTPFEDLLRGHAGLLEDAAHDRWLRAQALFEERAYREAAVLLTELLDAADAADDVATSSPTYASCWRARSTTPPSSTARSGSRPSCSSTTPTSRTPTSWSAGPCSGRVGATRRSRTCGWPSCSAATAPEPAACQVKATSSGSRADVRRRCGRASRGRSPAPTRCRRPSRCRPGGAAASAAPRRGGRRRTSRRPGRPPRLELHRGLDRRGPAADLAAAASCPSPRTAARRAPPERVRQLVETGLRQDRVPMSGQVRTCTAVSSTAVTGRRTGPGHVQQPRAGQRVAVPAQDDRVVRGARLEVEAEQRPSSGRASPASAPVAASAARSSSATKESRPWPGHSGHSVPAAVRRAAERATTGSPGRAGTSCTAGRSSASQRRAASGSRWVAASSARRAAVRVVMRPSSQAARSGRRRRRAPGARAKPR